MLTPDDYFGRMSRVAGEEPPEEVKANAVILLERVNTLLAQVNLLAVIDAARAPVVNSGWRTVMHNASIVNAAPRSKHITGQAIDLADPEGELDEFLEENQFLLRSCELWMESPYATKSWCHLQSIPPRSGNLVFMP